MQFTVWNLLIDFWKPLNKFCQKQEVVSRKKNWYCEMNVGTYRGTQTLFLCIFGLSMQVTAFWRHNLSHSLARNKLWGVLILYDIIFHQKLNFNMKIKVIKRIRAMKNYYCWILISIIEKVVIPSLNTMPSAITKITLCPNQP